MSSNVIGDCFARLEGWLSSFSIEVFSSIIQRDWIDEALDATGRHSKRIRKLGAQFMIWLVIAMNFYRRISIPNVLKRLGNMLGGGSLWEKGKVPSSASTVDARNRLGVAPMRLLVRRMRLWLLEKFAGAMKWKGMTLLALDGTTFKMPDSPENAKSFGLPGASRGRAAFPQMRAVFLISTKFHFVLDQMFAPYHKGETTLTMKLLAHIPKNSLLLLDRNFVSWNLLIRILKGESHFLVRAKDNIHGRLLKVLGKGDRLIEITIPRALRRRFPELPKFVVVRELCALVEGRKIRLFGSLTDAETYPASELISCYHDRWEEEIAIDEIKVHQCGATTVNRPVIFRSKSPRRVFQEAYGLVIVYNLIRSLMAQAGERFGVAPLRISFTDSLQRIGDAALCMAAAPTMQLGRIFEQLLFSLTQFPLPARRQRDNPREVCVKMSAFPRKLKRKQPA